MLQPLFILKLGQTKVAYTTWFCLEEKMKNLLMFFLLTFVLVPASFTQSGRKPAQELFEFSAVMTQLGDGNNRETYYTMTFPTSMNEESDSTFIWDPDVRHSRLVWALAANESLPKMSIQGNVIKIMMRDGGATSDCQVLYFMNEIAKTVRNHVAPNGAIWHSSVKAIFGDTYRDVTCVGR